MGYEEEDTEVTLIIQTLIFAQRWFEMEPASPTPLQTSELIKLGRAVLPQVLHRADTEHYVRGSGTPIPLDLARGTGGLGSEFSSRNPNKLCWPSLVSELDLVDVAHCGGNPFWVAGVLGGLWVGRYSKPRTEVR